MMGSLYPAAMISSYSSSSLGIDLPCMMTVAPCLALSIAVALPIPSLAPVMSMTLPLRLTLLTSPSDCMLLDRILPDCILGSCL